MFEEIILEIQEKIEEKQQQIEMLQNLNIDDVDEELFHELCETPLRSSEELLLVAKRIFKNGENFELHPNYIKFSLYGINCYISITRAYSIEIDTSWYKYIKIDDYVYPSDYNRKKLYLTECTNKSTSEIVDILYPDYKNYSKLRKLIFWNSVKDQYVDCEHYVKDIENRQELIYRSKVRRKNSVMEQVDILFNLVIPELLAWTKNVCAYKGTSSTDLDVIAKKENIDERKLKV